MPAPKDPEKLAAYKLKQSEITKERAKTRKKPAPPTAEAIANRAAGLKKHYENPAARKKLSDLAKANGNGKWMLGKKHSDATKEKVGARTRGKTYEELYGDAAESEMLKRAESNATTSALKVLAGAWPPEKFLCSSVRRSGKSYKEIYGDRADSELQKRSDGHQRRNLGRNRTGCRDRINGDIFYIRWRRAVFARDNYKCIRCGETGYMHAHHIKHWSKYPELRYEVENGETLCVVCHSIEHPSNAPLRHNAQIQILKRKE